VQVGDIGQAGTFPSIASMAGRITPPTVIVFGPSFSEAEGLREIAEFVKDRPAVSAVLVVESCRPSYCSRPSGRGWRTSSLFRRTRPQLLEAINRAADALNVATPTEEVAPGTSSSRRGRVITVFSTKGGAGKSFVATNLAVALAKRSDGAVCLIDADLQFGDVAVMLKLVPQHTIADAISSIHRLDEPLIRSLLIRHDAVGCWSCRRRRSRRSPIRSPRTTSSRSSTPSGRSATSSSWTPRRTSRTW